jgi:Fe-S-cluster containining protein
MEEILKKCNVSVCKAECCGIVPVKNIIVRTFKHLINKEAIIKRNGDISMVFDPETFKCGFLDNNCKCKIYENRPDVCRKFADPKETHPMLKCHYLGQISRVDQNKIIDKAMEGFI